MENIDNNTYPDNHIEVYEFKYNFVNTPWDDRSRNSKIGIVALLLAIFLATMACIINSFVMHYKEFGVFNLHSNGSKVNCQMVKMEDHPYVVRIHSVATQELLCVGALLNNNAVLANGACIKSGPIRLHMGNPNDRRCKKGFALDDIETIHHDGVISRKLVVLYSYEHLAECAEPLPIGGDLDDNSKAYIIGRSVGAGKSLSRQPVIISRDKDCLCSGMSSKTLNNKENTICAKGLARCPVLAGDLLVQKGRLYGLASTSTRPEDKNTLNCFADLKIIKKSLKVLGINTL